MKIAGVYPCDTELDVKVQHAVSELYGLEKILAVAKEDGHDVELFMPFKESDGKIVGISEEEMIQRILDYEPDVAAYSMFTCQYPMGKRIAGELKRHFGEEILNVAGNRYSTHLAIKERVIDNCFDFVVLNEGELIFRDLLREIENGRDFWRVEGLVVNDNGKALITKSRMRNNDLDSLPNALRFPLILNQAYQGISIPSLLERPGYAIMETSRGCFYQCDFCDVPTFYGKKLAFRAIERVVDEMCELKDKGADIFYFCDLNFTANPRYVLDFCEEIINRDLKFNWYCMSNIDTADKHPELLEAMKSAGCYKIAYGVESTNDGSLDKMNKGVNGNNLTYAQAYRVLERSLNAGIVNQGYYIVGFPWEDEESMMKDAEELKWLSLHHLNIGIFTPIPLSKLHRDMLSAGFRFDSNLEMHDRNHLVFEHPNVSADVLKKIQRKIHNDFYENSEYLGYVERLCKIDSSFERSFNEYFEFLGKSVRVGNKFQEVV